MLRRLLLLRAWAGKTAIRWPHKPEKGVQFARPQPKKTRGHGLNIVIQAQAPVATMGTPRHNGCLFGKNKVTHKCLHSRRQARRK